MPTLEDIATYSERLKICRDTLSDLLTQQILQGGKAYVLPATASSIREQRNQIARIKAVLRSWNIAVDDHPDDDPSLPIPTLEPEPAPPPDPTPEPARAPAPDPPRVGRINPLFPITIPEWRDELKRRNEQFGQPAGYWCYVRPGSYHIGGWEYDEDIETLDLPGFWIAKYPITVQQYRYFMQKGGYTDKHYWTPHGLQWKKQRERTQPWGWGEERLRGNNQPVIGLIWYEAVAFAAWLNAQLAAWLPDGYSIRLPTEAEWEAAAAYDEQMHRRIYPWGDTPEPDTSRADFGKDWQKEGPAPVGGRPDGAAACGAQDMVGSVWEPTASSYRGYPFKSHIVMDDTDPGSYDVVWRGGAYYFDITYIRCAARGRSRLDGDGDDDGVRIVVSPCVRTDVLISGS